jgi:death-on-curing protein
LPGLEATLVSPKNHWAYSGEENLFALAAVLMVAMAKAHPFNDANKRTSISCAVMFLGGNGISIQITDDDLVFHAVRAARCAENGRNQEVDSIALWLQLAATRT